MKHTEKLKDRSTLLNLESVWRGKSNMRSHYRTLHQLRYPRPSVMEKMTFIGNLLPKLLFFIPFGALLILSGFLCLKIQNLPSIAPTISNSDRAVILDKFK
jgi:hypothetical protein